MSMGISGISSSPSAAPQQMNGNYPGQMPGVSNVANALQPGYASLQNTLQTLMRDLETRGSSMSEGEKAALQRQVSHLSATVTLAVNVSLGIGKACEKLQQG